MKEKTLKHRIQIKKAQKYIEDNLGQALCLDDIAKVAGASKYHFIRIFLAYTHETPLEYSRKQKLSRALKMLNAPCDSITDIAFNLGFDSSSSFNKLFKKILKMNPTEFRNLGKEEKNKIIYSLSITKRMEELIMNLNLTQNPEIIEREETSVLSFEGVGEKFNEVAAVVWDKFWPILQEAAQDLSESEFFGISFTENEKHFYKAAISIPSGKSINIPALKKEKIKKKRYAKFLLKGSYSGVWPAFDFAYKKVSEMDFVLENAPCLENYLNDPQTTPEDELLTEILIPIK